MKRKSTVLGVVILLFVLSAIAPRPAEAIPAFARQYKISCTTCHVPFPRLNDYGAEFAGNGFVILEEENDRDFVIAGDDLLRLNKTFPFAGRFDAYAQVDSDNDVSNDLQIPWGLKLLSGGTLAENIGYYFYFYMSERGEVAGVEDAYIHFNNIGGRPLDVMVGQFQTCDPLMKRELRLTYEDYRIYKTKVGLSNVNLTYDRGIIITYDIEASGTGLVGLIVNGNGIGDAGADKIFDQDKYKNFGFRVMQDVVEPLSVGYFAYHGKELGYNWVNEDPADPNSALVQGPTYKNTILYHGPDLILGNGMFDLTVQYLFRTDTNPGFAEVDTDIETGGLVAELVISPQREKSRHYFTLLYNQIDSDLNEHDEETVTAGATYLISRNLRVLAEFTHDIEMETSRGTIGLVSGF